ncbi:hypothetical protein TWF730_003130 [Orbilia blumenaviensis]|uniref:LysM domain-containing protein n=1 Tax=Orbilia blumenaviensis TaxID=1796055 RepID=A0AAV9U4G6_9PEZI
MSRLIDSLFGLYADCDNVIVGNGYCMGSYVTALSASSTTSSSRTTTTSSTTTTATSRTTTGTTSSTTSSWPTPSSGTAPNCMTFAYFRAADTCDTFVARYASTGLTKANLILWNTLLLSDCSGLSDIRGHNVCIAVSVVTTTTTTSTKSTTPFNYPTPSSGTAGNCITLAYFRAADTCDIFVARYASTGLTKANLILWNTLLLSDCSGLSDIRGHNVCIAIDPTITTTTRTTSRTTSSTSTVLTPSPLMPGGCVSNCDMWYQTPVGGYDCGTTITIVGNFRGVVPGLTVADLKVFNPGIAPYCDANSVLPYETYICIHTPGWQPQSGTSTSISSASTSTIVTPLPTQSGMIAGCTWFHRVEFGEFCDIVVQDLISDFPGLTVAKLIYWNPGVGPDCDLIQQGSYLCVQGPNPPSTTTTSRVATTSASQTTSSRVPTTTSISRTTTTSSRTTTTSVTFTGNPASFPSASTPVCVPTTTTPVPGKVTGGATLNTAITTACQQLLGPSGSFFMDIGNPYKTTVTVGGHLTQFLIQIRLGGFSVTQSLCVTQFQSINTKCTTGSPALTPGGCFYTTDANMECCIFT